MSTNVVSKSLAKAVMLGAVPYAERQVMCLKADISELTEDTGWEPKTTFEEGIKMTIEKFKI